MAAEVPAAAGLTTGREPPGAAERGVCGVSPACQLDVAEGSRSELVTAGTATGCVTAGRGAVTLAAVFAARATLSSTAGVTAEATGFVATLRIGAATAVAAVVVFAIVRETVETVPETVDSTAPVAEDLAVGARGPTLFVTVFVTVDRAPATAPDGALAVPLAEAGAGEPDCDSGEALGGALTAFTTPCTALATAGAGAGADCESVAGAVLPAAGVAAVEAGGASV